MLNNPIYKEFCAHLNQNNPRRLNEIPFLPIQFFKNHQVCSFPSNEAESIFRSSGTTTETKAEHYIKDLSVYNKSIVSGFKHFYGELADYTILALLPGYLEKKDSSLIYMVNHLFENGAHKNSGFYLNQLDELKKNLIHEIQKGRKVLLIGVTHALLGLTNIPFSDKFKQQLIVMETGGMKGHGKELIREELHSTLKEKFFGAEIHSEYGMCEILSQAYSRKSGMFATPPWMKVIIRDIADPFAKKPANRTGGINIIDLANINSCSFIATDDLGRMSTSGEFEILGRFDNSDIRGCNLLLS
ncbi:MAG: hypothetical protein ACJAZ3_001029 [Sphingobacteriales bacterium]